MTKTHRLALINGTTETERTILNLCFPRFLSRWGSYKVESSQLQDVNLSINNTGNVISGSNRRSLLPLPIHSFVDTQDTCAILSHLGTH